jgi:hypothetical protein
MTRNRSLVLGYVEKHAVVSTGDTGRMVAVFSQAEHVMGRELGISPGAVNNALTALCEAGVLARLAAGAAKRPAVYKIAFGEEVPGETTPPLPAADRETLLSRISQQVQEARVAIGELQAAAGALERMVCALTLPGGGSQLSLISGGN